MSSVFRYLASSDNRPLHVALVLGFCLTLWGMRVPGYDLVWMLSGVSIFLIALLFILVRITTRLVIAFRNRKDPAKTTPRTMDGWAVWLLQPLALALLVLLGLNRLSFKLAWVLSRPSLNRFAASYDPAKKSPGKQCIGLFSFSSVSYSQDRLQLTFAKDEFPWGRRGLYFSPSGAPIESSHYYEEALGGGWHEWHYGGW